MYAAGVVIGVGIERVAARGTVEIGHVAGVVRVADIGAEAVGHVGVAGAVHAGRGLGGGTAVVGGVIGVGIVRVVARDALLRVELGDVARIAVGDDRRHAADRDREVLTGIVELPSAIDIEQGAIAALGTAGQGRRVVAAPALEDVIRELAGRREGVILAVERDVDHGPALGIGIENKLVALRRAVDGERRAGREEDVVEKGGLGRGAGDLGIGPGIDVRSGGDPVERLLPADRARPGLDGLLAAIHVK